MAIQNSGLRFDSREIAVIFSLFIFVSLLMFTVGILVGKGLAQAKFEGIPVASSPSPERQVTSADSASSHPHSPLSTSVSTNSPIASHKPEVPESHVKADTNSHSVSEPSHHGSVPPAHQSPEEHQPVHSEGLKALNEADEMAPSESEPLELKPKKSISPDIHKDITAKFDDPESEEVLNNPKLKELFEPDGAPVKIAKPNSNRAPASKTEKLVSSYPS
ncbi:MAG: hypothetical protein EBZ49_10220, partial [Proteobacteria bacterium]|nr:hypothetical protein [Pseudomonadota bacterium]